ncbi:MAG: antibiotic resistance protein MarC [Rickettsiales bacterium]|nr:antibiotic resistance protein MarC [Rickettsiales bacterium]|tara:strand:+ start:134 stop:757 length:624 start_codon:yes stop_codon:yes gene_type:complete
MHDLFLQNLIKAFIAIDPISLIPVFAVLTAGYSFSKIIKLSIFVFVITSTVLTFFSIFGNNFLIFMGISISSFQIVGGLFLLFISFEMVFEKRLKRKENLASKIIDNDDADELAVFPISIPLVAGPSAITLSILISKDIELNIITFNQQILPIILILFLTSLILLLSHLVVNFFNKALIMILQKIFGILLGALSVQYIINGFTESLV